MAAAAIGFAQNAALAAVAFPGAEGHGARTPGGRGGRIIEVTTLADTGAGSLRAALTATGPRIVVFRVGGTITARERIRVTSPFLTIAGQSAPGEGIQIRGAGLSIATNNVIVRGLRVRPGDASDGPDPQVRDGLEIWNANVIVDHCSFSWAVDETASTWFNTVADVTYQWNIFSEGLHASTHPRGPHSKGVLIGDGAKRVSLHHNLFAHQDERSPHMKGATDTEVINNVIYNWGGFGTHYATCHEDYDDRSSPVLSNVIANFFKPGPSSNTTRRPIFVNTSTCAIVASSRIYLSNNVGPGRPDNNGDQYAISNIPAGFRTTSPAATVSSIQTETAVMANERVLRCSGALAPQRDAVDARIVNEVKTGTGRIIDSQTQVGAWPAFPNATAPADNDHDGMADSWEQAKGLNPNDSTDGNKMAPSGYTWVEEYLNGLFTGDCFPQANAGAGGAAGMTGGSGGAAGGGTGSMMGGSGGMAGGAGGRGGSGMTPDTGVDEDEEPTDEEPSATAGKGGNGLSNGGSDEGGSSGQDDEVGGDDDEDATAGSSCQMAPPGGQPASLFLWLLGAALMGRVVRRRKNRGGDVSNGGL